MTCGPLRLSCAFLANYVPKCQMGSDSYGPILNTVSFLFSRWSHLVPDLLAVCITVQQENLLFRKLILSLRVCHRESSRDNMQISKDDAQNNNNGNGYGDVRNRPDANNDATTNATRPPGLNNIAQLAHTHTGEPTTTATARMANMAISPTSTLKSPTSTLRSPTSTLRSPTSTLGSTTDQIASEVKNFDFR